jgi:transcriptional regulator with XRE-family HTH domain
VSKSADDLLAAYRIRAHLRKALAQRDLTKIEMARRLNVDDGNLGRLLTGERHSFTAGQVLAISREFRVNPTQLLEEPPPAEFTDEAVARAPKRPAKKPHPK